MAKKFTRNISHINKLTDVDIDNLSIGDIIITNENQAYIKLQDNTLHKITHQIETLSTDGSVFIGKKDKNDDVKLSVYTGYIDYIVTEKNLKVEKIKDENGKFFATLNYDEKPLIDLIETKQDKLIAGENIKIEDNVISSVSSNSSDDSKIIISGGNEEKSLCVMVDLIKSDLELKDFYSVSELVRLLIDNVGKLVMTTGDCINNNVKNTCLFLKIDEYNEIGSDDYQASIDMRFSNGQSVSYNGFTNYDDISFKVDYVRNVR